MLKLDTRNFDANGDPAPAFATDAEIEIAERLRHQIEQRYLAPASNPAPARPRSSEGHRH